MFSHIRNFIMKKKKTRIINNLNEEQLNEFIGKLASYVLRKKGDAHIQAMAADPRFHDAVDAFVKGTKEFEAELRRIGVRSKADLDKAIKNNPNVRDIEKFI